MYRLTKFVRDMENLKAFLKQVEVATISANRISTLPRAACQLPDRKFHLSSSKAERIVGVGPVFVRCYFQAPVDRQGPGSDPKQFAEKTKETQEEDKTVVDYAENPRHYGQSHYRVPNQNPTNFGEAMELVGFLRGQLEKLDSMIYANVYRKQIIRMEVLFSKREFFEEFPSFSIICAEMLPLFNQEREKNCLEEVTVDERKLYEVFSKNLSRVEKWRIILGWIFHKLLVEGECNDQQFGNFLNVLKKESHTFINDNEVIKSSAQYGVVREFMDACYKQLPITSMKEVTKLIREFEAISRGIHFGFQRCSKEIKRFENITSSKTNLLHVRKLILIENEETVDSHLVGQCMDIIVSIAQK